MRSGTSSGSPLCAALSGQPNVPLIADAIWYAPGSAKRFLLGAGNDIMFILFRMNIVTYQAFLFRYEVSLMLNTQTYDIRKRKYVCVLLIAVFLAFGLSGCKLFYKGVRNISEECQYLLYFLDCDYELFSSETKPEKIISRFNVLTKQGETDGFYPLIIIPSDTLIEILYYYMEEIDIGNIAESIAAFRESIIVSANEINAKEFLSDRLIMPDDIMGDFMQAEPQNALRLEYLAYDSSGEVIIAKIPTANPWELQDQ